MELNQHAQSKSAQKVIRLAEQLAVEYALAEYGPSHLLWAVTDDDVGLSVIT
ncbi:MAG: hypothetical protein ACI9AT_001031 [Ulvibacter sp.]|jgi:hypothetical protein